MDISPANSVQENEDMSHKLLVKKLLDFCFEGDCEILGTLPKEVDVNKLHDSTGETPAQIAAKHGNVNSLKFLVKNGADINLLDQEGHSLLMLALKSHQEVMASYLLELGISLKAKEKKNNETALHFAVRCSYGKLVESMILAGAETDAQDSRGITCLHLACMNKNVSIACMLIHLGAHIEIPNNQEETALHVACKKELFPVVNLMCSRQCPINETNKLGNTPLHLAAKAGNLDLIRLLLISGADIDVFNKDGLRAEDIALVQGYTEASDLLSKLGNSIATDKLSPLRDHLKRKHPMNSIKVKVFGNKQSGKTTLIDSLKCGFLWSFVKKFYNGLDLEEPQSAIDGQKAWVDAPNENYTKGISVHQADISGIGKLSLWEFSGFEPYFAYYDFFMGDPSCIHVITFSLLNDLQLIKNQLFFWLNFIRARIALHIPIGAGGTQLWSPHVVFVATHASEENCLKDHEGNFVMKGWDEILVEIKENFEIDLIVLPNLHVLNAHEVNSAGMKTLKSTILKLKEFLTDYNGKGMDLLDQVVRELPSWIKRLKYCPVVTWSNFVKYIRGKINPLVLEDHAIDLVNEMQIIGEVVYLPKFDNLDDLIVLNPRWLATDILGKMLSFETIQSSSISGQFSPDQLSLMFPDFDSSDLKSILHRLDFCLEFQCSYGQTLYHFPALDFTPSPQDVWDGWSIRPENSVHEIPELDTSFNDSSEIQLEVWQGIRISCTCERGDYGDQINIIYPRIAVVMERSLSDTNNCPVNVKRVNQWATGVKIEADDFVTVVMLSQHDIDIITRGKKSKEKSMFHFSEYCFGIIMGKILQVCPGLSVQRSAISTTDLQRNSKFDQSNKENGYYHLRVYDAREILDARLNHRESIKKGSKEHINGLTESALEFNEESIIDLIAFGSKEVLSLITFGTDVHISLLSIHARFGLAHLLDTDPINDSENSTDETIKYGWKELAKILQASNFKVQNTMELTRKDGISDQEYTSKTDEVLAAWSYQEDATIGNLALALQQLSRPDAKAVLLGLSPLFLRSELLASNKIM